MIEILKKQHSSKETDCQAILPLRCLLEKDTTQWSYLQMFEDHCNVSTYVSKLADSGFFLDFQY